MYQCNQKRGSARAKNATLSRYAKTGNFSACLCSWLGPVRCAHAYLSLIMSAAAVAIAVAGSMVRICGFPFSLLKCLQLLDHEAEPTDNHTTNSSNRRSSIRSNDNRPKTTTTACSHNSLKVCFNNKTKGCCTFALICFKQRGKITTKTNCKRCLPATASGNSTLSRERKRQMIIANVS